MSAAASTAVVTLPPTAMMPTTAACDEIANIAADMSAAVATPSPASSARTPNESPISRHANAIGIEWRMPAAHESRGTGSYRGLPAIKVGW